MVLDSIGVLWLQEADAGGSKLYFCPPHSHPQCVLHCGGIAGMRKLVAKDIPHHSSLMSQRRCSALCCLKPSLKQLH